MITLIPMMFVPACLFVASVFLYFLRKEATPIKVMKLAGSLRFSRSPGHLRNEPHLKYNNRSYHYITEITDIGDMWLLSRRCIEKEVIGHTIQEVMALKNLSYEDGYSVLKTDSKYHSEHTWSESSGFGTIEEALLSERSHPFDLYYIEYTIIKIGSSYFAFQPNGSDVNRVYVNEVISFLLKQIKKERSSHERKQF
jgi:hypothetical protein